MAEEVYNSIYTGAQIDRAIGLVLEAGAMEVDAQMSSTSEHPVQNKVVNNEIQTWVNHFESLLNSMFMVMTQAEYNSITPDPNTFYFIKDSTSQSSGSNDDIVIVG